MNKTLSTFIFAISVILYGISMLSLTVTITPAFLAATAFCILGVCQYCYFALEHTNKQMKTRRTVDKQSVRKRVSARKKKITKKKVSHKKSTHKKTAKTKT